MSTANSEGQRRRWAKVSAKKKAEIMARLQRAKWAKMTKAQRSAHGKMMRAARNPSHGRKRK